MELHESFAYNAPIGSVIAMLEDRDATVAKYESMGHHEVEVLDLERRRGRLWIISTRVVDVELPSFAKRVLRPTNTMLQTDEWERGPDGSWAGTFDVEVKGAPVHIYGAMSLHPHGRETTHDVSVHVDVKIPLIGSRVAAWAAQGDVRRSVEGEFAFNSAWLGTHAVAV